MEHERLEKQFHLSISQFSYPLISRTPIFPLVENDVYRFIQLDLKPKRKSMFFTITFHIEIFPVYIVLNRTACYNEKVVVVRYRKVLL